MQQPPPGGRRPVVVAEKALFVHGPILNIFDLALPESRPRTLGDVARDSLTGPGLSELDFSAAKSSKLTENLHLQLRAEFFNILNHTNFLTPNEVVYASATGGISPTAGVVTATSTTSRQIQFGAKLLF